MAKTIKACTKFRDVDKIAWKSWISTSHMLQIPQNGVQHNFKTVLRFLFILCQHKKAPIFLRWIMKFIKFVNRGIPVCVQVCDHIEVQLCMSLQLLGSCENIVRMSTEPICSWDEILQHEKISISKKRSQMSKWMTVTAYKSQSRLKMMFL